MTHIAMVDDGNAGTSGDHVTDEKYGKAPAVII